LARSFYQGGGYCHASNNMPSNGSQLPVSYRTPIGGRGPRLLVLLCAEGSESMFALSPLPMLADAEPVRLRVFTGPFGGWRALTPAYCSTCCGAIEFPWPGGGYGPFWRIPPGGDGLPPTEGPPIYPLGGEGLPLPLPNCGLNGAPGDWLVLL